VSFRSRRLAVATLLLSLAGALLFVVTLRRAGLAVVIAQVSSLALRALAWTRSVDGEPGLPFRDAFGATLMGDALGKVTSLSALLSEPAKAVAVGRRVPLGAALAGLFIENVVYGTSLALMVGLGAVALLLSYQMPPALRWVSMGAIGGMFVAVGVALALLGTRAAFLTGLVGRLVSWRLLPRRLEERAGDLKHFEDRVGSFARRNPRRLVQLAACEAGFHAAGIAEVYVTLVLVGTSLAPTLVAALILESAGRLINVVFSLVPLRLGVDEAGSGLLANVLRLGAASGVTLALVRKARILVWAGVGVVLLLVRGLSLKGLVTTPPAAPGTAGATQPDADEAR
jgi:Lysylphosphatidylglycerol synthase TM region